MLAGDMFAAQAGVQLLEAQPGHALARMEVTSRHLNSKGICQGGALFTLADLAFAAVANSRGFLTLSLNANITFLRPVSRGYVYAEGNEVFDHKRVPFIEVRLTDEEGNLVAIFTSSGYRKREPLNM